MKLTKVFKLLTAGALLTFCGVVNSNSLRADDPADSLLLTGTVRDFSDVHPDFERNPGDKNAAGMKFKYGSDRNYTKASLDAEGKPDYDDYSISTTGKQNFDQWFRDVPGVNESMPLAIRLDRQDDGTYRYENTDFFPVNNKLIGNEGRNKNFHFTYEIDTNFTYNGGEVFDFSGDDDVFVYINGQKVIDIGGVHMRQDASVDLDTIAADIGIEVGKTYDFKFFFAERHTTQSNFVITTNLEFEQLVFAD